MLTSPAGQLWSVYGNSLEKINALTNLIIITIIILIIFLLLILSCLLAT